MRSLIALSSAAMVTALFSSTLLAQVDSNFHCYLLFGQSNMAGGGAVSDNKTLDCDTTPRVTVLAFCDCSGTSSNCSRPLTRTRDTWYTAFPPLHICSEGISPGDWFAKTMLDSIRSDIKIGLIPCALSGQALEVFMKGQSNFNIPTWAHPTIVNSSPYAWMVNRCKIAQRTGVIKGILLHQGESGAGSRFPSLTWVNMAKGIFDSLKKDLALDAKTPVVAGELLQASGACCAGFNTNINQLASQYPNCKVASSKDLPGNGRDPYHFNPTGMRELGKRYANQLLSLASQEFIPRKGTTRTVLPRAAQHRDLQLTDARICIYSLNGRAVRSNAATDPSRALRNVHVRGVYIVSYTLGNGRSAVVPVIKE